MTTPTVPENLISPSKSDGPVITDFGPDSPLVLSEKMNSTPNMEEYKMDMNTPGEQKKVFEQVEVKYDTSIIKKASSPNTSIVSESQAVSPPSSKTSTLTSNLDLKSKVESSMQESPAEEVLCIWDNKLDFVKNSYIKGLPTKTDHLNLSEFNFDNEYTQPIIILLLNQFGALGREKEEFCNNLLKKFGKISL